MASADPVQVITFFQVDAQEKPAKLQEFVNTALTQQVNIMFIHNPWPLNYARADDKVSSFKRNFIVHCSYVLPGKTQVLVLVNKRHENRVVKKGNYYDEAAITTELKILNPQPIMICAITSTKNSLITPQRASNYADEFRRVYAWKYYLLAFVLDDSPQPIPFTDLYNGMMNVMPAIEGLPLIIHSDTRMHQLFTREPELLPSPVAGVRARGLRMFFKIN